MAFKKSQAIWRDIVRKLLVEIAYQGTRYHGYQFQQNALSVAEVVQDAIEKVFKKREDISGCSRTDTGVHANQYFFHMTTLLNIAPNAVVIALNNYLPGDIVVRSCREVPLDFHARYHVCWKEYLYKIYNATLKNPFCENQALLVKDPLDADFLDRCFREFIGTHDFAGFRNTGAKIVDDTVRTIYDCSVRRTGDFIDIVVTGDGFLYNMVRIMVGTLLGSPKKKIKEGDIAKILATKDRLHAGATAPAAGLYLNRVSYEEYPKATHSSSLVFRADRL
ncbi:MAG: tRNA pseudouridine(38-40) synthase TruA [Oscillospiraceae bacterium]